MHEMEAERSKTLVQTLADDPNTAMSHGELSTGDQVLQSKVPVRSSTPIPVDAAGTSQASLNALESELRVVDNPGSQLPELLPATRTDTPAALTRKSPDDEDCESFVCDVPVLLMHEPKVRILADFSEVEKTTGETSSVDCPSL